MMEKKVREKKEIFRLVEGVSAVTLITSEDFHKEINKTFKNTLNAITYALDIFGRIGSDKPDDLIIGDPSLYT